MPLDSIYLHGAGLHVALETPLDDRRGPLIAAAGNYVEISGSLLLTAQSAHVELLTRWPTIQRLQRAGVYVGVSDVPLPAGEIHSALAGIYTEKQAPWIPDAATQVEQVGGYLEIGGNSALSSSAGVYVESKEQGVYSVGQPVYVEAKDTGSFHTTQGTYTELYPRGLHSAQAGVYHEHLQIPAIQLGHESAYLEIFMFSLAITRMGGYVEGKRLLL